MANHGAIPFSDVDRCERSSTQRRRSSSEYLTLRPNFLNPGPPPLIRSFARVDSPKPRNSAASRSFSRRIKGALPYDSLLVERGNENIMYSRGRFKNRFNYTKKKQIRFFVEDDWIKASKLAYICDVVFLIDHPYNQPRRLYPTQHTDEAVIGRIPENVIRVRSWVELKKAITQLA